MSESAALCLILSAPLLIPATWLYCIGDDVFQAWNTGVPYYMHVIIETDTISAGAAARGRRRTGSKHGGSQPTSRSKQPRRRKP